MENLYKYGIGVFSLLVISCLLYKITNIYQNENIYVEARGIVSKDVAADSAKINVVIRNDVDEINEDAAKKHEEDMTNVKNFLLTKFEIGELISERTYTNCNYVRKDGNKKAYTIETYFIVNTKKMDRARKILNELMDLIKKNIQVSAYNVYFCQDSKKIIDDLVIEATQAAKEKAELIAKASGNKIVRLKTISKPIIEYKQKDYHGLERYNSCYFVASNTPSYFEKFTVSVDAMYNIA